MKRRIPSLVAGVAFAVGIFASFAIADAQNKAMAPVDVPAPGKTPLIEVNLISFDPAIGDVNGRLHLRLPKAMVTREAEPIEDLVFVDGTTVDESILNIAHDRPFSDYDAFINSRYQVNDPGSEFWYPFDKHITYLHFFVEEKEPQGLTELPVAYDCSGCDFDGFNVNVGDAGTTATDVRLRLEISRTHPIIIFAIFIAIGMWAMTIVISVVAIRVARKRKKAPEVATMGFIGGLLFAFPAIRGAQPRVPPMGVFSDYIAFFWCEFILMAMLVVVMIAWLRFPEPEEEE